MIKHSMKAVYLFIVASILHSAVLAQSKINQFDAQGNRHGEWKKYFEGTEQLRYEGQFEHGNEVGTFKFYCEACGSQPMVVKQFSAEDDTADVSYFTIDGKLVSKGKMRGKERTGEWVYYQEKSDEIMTREFYKNGKLDGLKTTYYTNGKITEEQEYKNGSKEGKNLYYSPEGVLIKKLQYVEDKLHGPAEYFDAKGNLIIQGQYKDGAKHGVWKYYENGELKTQETFPKPTKG